MKCLHIAAIAAPVGVGLLLMAILLPLSLHRIGFDEVGVSYDEVSRDLGSKLLREGLHDLGPSASILMLKTTQRSADYDNLRTLTQDGLEVDLDVSVLYSLKVTSNDVFAIIDDFGSQKNFDAFVGVMCAAAIRDTSQKYPARDFYLLRHDFQTALQRNIQVLFSELKLPVTLNFVQVTNIELPVSIEADLRATTVAQQDIQNANAERAARVQTATILGNLSEGQAILTMLNGSLKALQTEQETVQEVLKIRNRYLYRTYAFGNISLGLGGNGSSFVDNYLSQLVLQETRAKNIINLG